MNDKKLQNYLDYLVNWIREVVNQSNSKGVIVGLSGGIDSAVVANLAKLAFPDDYLTVWMPISSQSQDYQAIDEIIQKNQLKTITIDLNSTFETFKKTIDEYEIIDLALANTKARLRMTSLYAIAQSKQYLVLGTDNLDEWHIGYFTKFGDGGVDLVPLIHLLKSEVRQAAKLLNVPELIINRKPTAGLWEGQTDENEIGYTYDQIDDYLMGNNNNLDLKKRIDQLHKNSEHKRNLAVQPKKIDRN